MSGVPRMSEMYALTTTRTSAKRDFLSSATIIPSGIEPKSVSAKMPKDLSMPMAIVENMVENVMAKVPHTQLQARTAGRLCTQHGVSAVHNG